MGLSSIALSAMLHRDGIVQADESSVWQPPTGQPHFPAKAKSVIWIFLRGGLSHLESFDPKPTIDKYAGKTIGETPFKSVQDSPYLKENVRKTVVDDANGRQRNKLFPLQVGFKKCGEVGAEVSDWWPHLRKNVDDLAIVRSMWTTDDNHGAQMQFHTGRHTLEGCFPTIGSWVHYGLGTLNEDLPQFISMGPRLLSCDGGHRADYLGPQHDGVVLKIDPKNPLPYAKPELDLDPDEQRQQFDLLGRLNRLTATEYPRDTALQARIKSYELAFRMQTAVPKIIDFSQETKATRALYGLDKPVTKPFAEQLLSARRFVEQGVRFIQIFHGPGAAGAWDSHSNLKTNHSKLCAQVDQPIAGLLQDLKQRGLLEDTLVVLGTEFGRTPGSQGSTGRDHHVFGFSVCMAGGGLKRGIVHGATDEIGFHAVEDRHYVSDVGATVLHQLGLDPHRLAIPGRKRLEKDIGKPIDAIIG